MIIPLFSCHVGHELDGFLDRTPLLADKVDEKLSPQPTGFVVYRVTGMTIALI